MYPEFCELSGTLGDLRKADYLSLSGMVFITGPVLTASLKQSNNNKTGTIINPSTPN